MELGLPRFLLYTCVLPIAGSMLGSLVYSSIPVDIKVGAQAAFALVGREVLWVFVAGAVGWLAHIISWPYVADRMRAFVWVYAAPALRRGPRAKKRRERAKQRRPGVY
jgi:hypothetical protein